MTDPQNPYRPPEANIQPSFGGDRPSGSSIPWERRSELGWFKALWETIRLFLFSPEEAFRRTQRSGDYVGPLIFAMILGAFGSIIGQIYNFGLQFFLMALGGGAGLGLTGLDTAALGGLGVGLTLGIVLLTLVLYPIFLFISAAIFHVCILLVGGLRNSETGFEGTFRSVCYGHSPYVLAIIPFLGGAIYPFWFLILVIFGLKDLHRAQTWQAVLAGLLPLILCCLLMALGFAALIPAMMAA